MTQAHLNPEILAELERIRRERQQRSDSNGTARSVFGEWDAGDDVELPPPRGWIYGNIFCRRFVSSLLGDGGVGKTALRYAQLLSPAIGRSLTGDHVFQRCRVLIASLEDDGDELRRRILAAMLHHKIERDDVKGWLFLAALGADVGKLMTTDRYGRLARGALAENLESVIASREIDLVSLDPFVKTHAVEENSNTAERGRGASAMNNAGRLIYTLSTMTSEEAQAFGISERDRKSFVRMDSAKVNITRPLDSAKWFRLVGVRLGNASGLYPNGDEVQTVEVWEPPDTWSDLAIDLLNRMLTAIDGGLPNGSRYSDAPNAKERAAWRAVLEYAPHKTELQAREIIKVWVANGVLRHRDYDDPEDRKTRRGLWVDNAKRPS
jgi:hypothetical protein